eukprot:snap_masked-scaffold_7-processed-gene-13.45-mRNA-1 protein AED:1.00 eAED:1.00 QI:0/0/0/0/1/1/2/0/615
MNGKSKVNPVLRKSQSVGVNESKFTRKDNFMKTESNPIFYRSKNWLCSESALSYDEFKNLLKDNKFETFGFTYAQAFREFDANRRKYFVQPRKGKHLSDIIQEILLKTLIKLREQSTDAKTLELHIKSRAESTIFPDNRKKLVRFGSLSRLDSLSSRFIQSSSSIHETTAERKIRVPPPKPPKKKNQNSIRTDTSTVRHEVGTDTHSTGDKETRVSGTNTFLSTSSVSALGTQTIPEFSNGQKNVNILEYQDKVRVLKKEIAFKNSVEKKNLLTVDTLRKEIEIAFEGQHNAKNKAELLQIQLDDAKIRVEDSKKRFADSVEEVKRLKESIHLLQMENCKLRLRNSHVLYAKNNQVQPTQESEDTFSKFQQELQLKLKSFEELEHDLVLSREKQNELKCMNTSLKRKLEHVQSFLKQNDSQTKQITDELLSLKKRNSNLCEDLKKASHSTKRRLDVLLDVLHMYSTATEKDRNKFSFGVSIVLDCKRRMKQDFPGLSVRLFLRKGDRIEALSNKRSTTIFLRDRPILGDILLKDSLQVRKLDIRMVKELEETSLFSQQQLQEHEEKQILFYPTALVSKQTFCICALILRQVQKKLFLQKFEDLSALASILLKTVP